MRFFIVILSLLFTGFYSGHAHAYNHVDAHALFIVDADTESIMDEEKENQDQDIETITIEDESQWRGANYQIIAREQFINNAQTLADVLQSINGIQITQISGLGNPVSVSIRGSSSKQVQLYIDGQLINDSQFGGFDLNQIPVEQIQSIEISKDQAIGTGATPIGGVIRINTYNANKNLLRFSAALGSFGQQELNLMANTAFEEGSLAVGYNHLNSDNDYDYWVKQTFLDSKVSQNEPLTNNQFKKNSFFVNGQWTLSKHQFRLNYQASKQTKHLPNYQNNSPLNISSLTSDNQRVAFSHLWLNNDGWLEQLETQLYQDVKDEVYLGSIDGTRPTIGLYDSNQRSLLLRGLISHQQWAFSPFLNIEPQIFSSKTTFNGQTNSCNSLGACDIKATRRQITWGNRAEFEHETEPFSAYLLFSQLLHHSENIALNEPNAQRITNSDSYWTGEVGVNYWWSDIQWQANWSRGLRTATMFELFGDRGAFKGNQALAPEQSQSWSLAADYQATSWNIKGAIYRKQLQNSIVAIFNSANVGGYRNVSNALLLGAELSIAYQVSKDLTLDFNADVIDSNTTSIFKAFNNKRLPGIYHQQYSAAISYRMSEQLSLKFVSEISNDLFFNMTNKVELNQGVYGSGAPSDRQLSKLNINWYHDSYRVSVGINNLFNQRYKDLANRPAQGRSLQIKFSIEEQ